MTVLPNSDVRQHKFAIAPYMRSDDLCSPYSQKRPSDNTTHCQTPYSKRHKPQVMPFYWASLPRECKALKLKEYLEKG